MITNLQRADTHHGRIPAVAGLQERCPFLQQVGEAQWPKPRPRPAPCRWPAGVAQIGPIVPLRVVA